MALDLVDERSGVFTDVLQETLLTVYRSNAVFRPVSVNIVSSAASNVRVHVRQQTGRMFIRTDPSLTWIFPRKAGDRRLVEAMAKSPYRLVDSFAWFVREPEHNRYLATRESGGDRKQ